MNKQPLTPSLDERVLLADDEVASYLFGEGVSVVDQDNWNRDEPNDLTKIIYVAYSDDEPDAESHRLSFHVRFDAAGHIEDAYALSMESGGDVGVRGTEMPCFIYTYSVGKPPRNNSGTKKTVRIWRVIQNKPTLVAEKTDTFVDEFQLVMDALQENNVLPLIAFERHANSIRKYQTATDLLNARIADIVALS